MVGRDRARRVAEDVGRLEVGHHHRVRRRRLTPVDVARERCSRLLRRQQHLRQTAAADAAEQRRRRQVGAAELAAAALAAVLRERAAAVLRAAAVVLHRAKLLRTEAAGLAVGLAADVFGAVVLAATLAER